MNSQRPDPDLLDAWAASVAGSLRPAAVRERSRQQLLARVASSAAAHASFLTVRRESGDWTPAGTGLQARTLRRDRHVVVDVLRLEDGAAVPAVDGDAVAQELLVVEGCLTGTQAVDGCTLRLPAHSHAVLDAASSNRALRAAGPVVLYRRVLRAPFAELPAPEAAWWQAACAASAGRRARGASPWRTAAPWRNNGRGVQVLPLQTCGHVVSMLVRFEAGAGVPDHTHEIDEDCLVLQGEMFLGDVLLRAGDYQLAPAGGGHVDENSDVGVCFYFHGALDAKLLAERR